MRRHVRRDGSQVMRIVVVPAMMMKMLMFLDNYHDLVDMITICTENFKKKVESKDCHSKEGW